MSRPDRAVLPTALIALLLAPASAAAGTLTLSGTVRDFTPATNADFEYLTGSDPDIVETTLGSDLKPVYNTTTSNPTKAIPMPR